MKELIEKLAVPSLASGTLDELVRGLAKDEPEKALEAAWVILIVDQLRFGMAGLLMLGIASSERSDKRSETLERHEDARDKREQEKHEREMESHVAEERRVQEKHERELEDS